MKVIYLRQPLWRRICIAALSRLRLCRKWNSAVVNLAPACTRVRQAVLTSLYRCEIACRPTGYHAVLCTLSKSRLWLYPAAVVIHYPPWTGASEACV